MALLLVHKEVNEGGRFRVAFLRMKAWQPCINTVTPLASLTPSICILSVIFIWFIYVADWSRTQLVVIHATVCHRAPCNKLLILFKNKTNCDSLICSGHPLPTSYIYILRSIQYFLPQPSTTPEVEDLLLVMMIVYDNAIAYTFTKWWISRPRDLWRLSLYFTAHHSWMILIAWAWKVSLSVSPNQNELASGDPFFPST